MLTISDADNESLKATSVPIKIIMQIILTAIEPNTARPRLSNALSM